MRETQDFTGIQANIRRAQAHLLVLSQQLDSWREFNRAAKAHLASARRWEGASADDALSNLES